jgi:tetratricopeptide (TPR) repeat protein
LNQQFTRTEVGRILGTTRRQLDYWARLGLVEPRARWGERFYSFADLVALVTVKELTGKGIPARRLRRSILALQTQLGELPAPLSELRITTNGRQVVVLPPGPSGRAIEPLTGQFVLDFKVRDLGQKVRQMSTCTAEEWFEIGLANDSSPETLEKAADAYRRAVELAPDWVEAYINLGTTLYQLQRMEESRRCFAGAVALEPSNPLAHFNMGCVLEQLGETEAAIAELQRAVRIAPNLADAHLNLALAYEKHGQKQDARKHLSLYLHYEPQGPWAEFARSQIGRRRGQGRAGKLTPFRRNG